MIWLCIPSSRCGRPRLRPDHPAHRLAEVVFNRWGGVRERAEHQAAEHLHVQRLQAMLSHVEIVRHAALAAQAVAEGHALQPSREVVAPRMVHAGQRFRVAAILQADKRALVRAAIDHRMDRAVLVAGDNDRHFPDRREPPVAGIGNLDLQAEKIPDRSAEQQPLLARIDFRVGEQAEGTRDTPSSGHSRSVPGSRVTGTSILSLRRSTGGGR